MSGKTNLDSEPGHGIFSHNRTTMKLYCSFGDCQSEAASPCIPVAIRFHAIERLEYLPQHGVRHSWPFVSDRNHGKSLIAIASYLYRLTEAIVANCIPERILHRAS